jgi:hypothetical protein
MTREGKRIDAVHRFFQEQMIRSVVRDIPDDAKKCFAQRDAQS